MPDHLPLALPCFQNRPASDVVYEGVRSHDDADVPESVPVQILGDEVAGKVGFLALLYLAAVTFEKGLEVRDAAMINIFIGSLQAP